MAQWIRPQTLNHEVPGSNLLAVASSIGLPQLLPKSNFHVSQIIAYV